MKKNYFVRTFLSFLLFTMITVSSFAQGDCNDLTSPIETQIGLSVEPAGFFVRSGSQLGRIFRDAIPSACPSKVYPGIFNAGTTYNYTAIRFYNSDIGPTCITVNFDPNSGAAPCTTNGHAMIYQGAGGVSTTPYDPANQGTNYLGDVGSSATQPFSATVEPGWFEVVFTNTSAAANCSIQFSFAPNGGVIMCDMPSGGGPVNVCGTGNPQPIPVTGTGGFPCVGGPTTSPANVSATGTIGAAAGDYTLDSVEINLNHTWDSDLDITLVSPMGTSLDLSSDNGGSGDNYTNTVFMDGAPLITTGAAPFTGTFQAEGGTFATTFAGEPINGNWTLSICDDTGGDSGTLLSYCINFSEILVVGNPPTITCPGDITINNTGGLCSGVANFIGIAEDIEDGNISGRIIIATPPSGSAFAVGDTMVTLSVTDSDGNTATCDFMVTVLDAEDPVAVCQDITVDLDASGMATITAADVDNGSTDNCAIASMSLDVSSFDCSMTGANTVTLTVTDTAGNSSTCTSTVTVQDVTAPEIFCIGGIANVSESEDFEAGLPAGWSTVVNTGTCDWINSGDMPTGDDFPTLAMLFDDDDCGSGAPASNVTLLSAVYDLTGASNATMGYDVAFQESGIQTFTVEAWDGAAWQQIALYDEDLDPDIQTESFDVSALANAAFQVRWTFDDNNGEWGWGAGVDNFLLEYEVSAGGGLDVYLDANGMASVDPNDLVTGVNEACGYTITAGGGGGGTMGSLSTLFASNNGGSAGWTVMYDLTVGPNDIEVTDIDVNIDGTSAFNLDMYTLVGTYVGNETNAAAWGAPAASGTGTGLGIDMPSNAVLGTPVTLTANTTYGIAIVTDSGQNYTNGDGSNQNFSNADLSVSLGSAVAGLFSGSVFNPRVWNGTINYIVGGGGGDLDFTCADLGENQIEVTVTDDSGNVDTCIATVNVIDNTPPVLVCQDATIELGPDGTATVDPNALLASMPTTYEVMVIGSDNQSGNEGFTDFTVNVTEAAAVTFDWDYTSNDVPGFDSFGYLLNGTYTQLTDPLLGNQSGSAAVAVAPGDVFGFRSQTDDNVFGNNETVISNFMPGFDGQFDPANWMLTLTESDGDAFFTEIPGGPLSFDACGITVLAVDVPTVSCADIGTPITVTVFASDASGNTASCTSVITVVDLLGPELTCPADQTVDPGAGNLFYILPDYFATGEATADDNCTDPVTITTQDPAPGTPLPDGTYTITMTATDEYGNTSTCDFELTVETILGVDSNNLEAGLALYPNPAGNVVNLVNRTNISLEKMMIFDINGKLVSQTDLRTMQGEKAVDVSSLASGVYMVQIIGDNASTVKRLIKE